MERQELHSDISGIRRFLRGRHLVVLACLLVVGAWLLVHAASTYADLVSATVRVEPSIQVVDLGEHFTVDVWVEDAVDLGGYEFNGSFDPSIGQAEDVEAGEFLASTGLTPTVLGPIISNISGTIDFGEFGFGGGSGPSGAGKLATIQLKATDLHSTTLGLDGVVVVDTQGNPQPVLPPVGGTVLVNTAINGKFKEWCQPQGWVRRNMDQAEKTNPPGPGTVDCLDDGQVKTGPYAVKFTGSPTKKKLLKQNRYVSGGAGETFKLSGWSYVTAPPGTALGWQAYKIVVRVTYTDDSWEEHQVVFSPLSANWNTWQYREVEFTTADAYKKFEVFVKFFEKPETAIAWFDDIRLVRELP
jgi:hypothetical protein